MICTLQEVGDDAMRRLWLTSNLQDFYYADIIRERILFYGSFSTSSYFTLFTLSLVVAEKVYLEKLFAASFL